MNTIAYLPISLGSAIIGILATRTLFFGSLGGLSISYFAKPYLAGYLKFNE